MNTATKHQKLQTKPRMSHYVSHCIMVQKQLKNRNSTLADLLLERATDKRRKIFFYYSPAICNFVQKVLGERGKKSKKEVKAIQFIGRNNARLQ